MTCSALNLHNMRPIVIMLSVLFMSLWPLGRTTAQISVTPLWDVAVNSHTQPCRFEHIHDPRGTVFLQGSPHLTCSFQINASSESYARIQIPKGNISEESFWLYIERKGDLVHCENRFLVFNRNADELCSAEMLQASFHLNLQGNVGILVDVISSIESHHVCPESNDEILSSPKVNQTSDCKKVKGYISQITCELHDSDTCNLIFPSNCNATLGYNEVVLLCYENGVNQIKHSLIPYPIGTIILDLGYNSIINLEANSFEDFDDLQVLYLQQNYLATFPFGVFTGLENLIGLYLSRNQLKTVNASAFRGLNKLTTLALDDNKFTTFPDGLFVGLENLNKLYLYGNQLVTLNYDTFQGMGKLTLLTLNYNKLTTLPGGLFGVMESLYKLYLHGNQLVGLNANIFVGLIKITYISLRDNQLKSLPSGLFSGLNNLNRLFLYRNQLVALDTNTFQGLSGLTLLYMYNNSLSTLPSGLFRGMEKLNKLSLAGNKLAALEKSTFYELTKLTYLSLRDNKLEFLPSELFEDLDNLYELYLNKNKLARLSSLLFNNLKHLGILLIHENRLTLLPKGLFIGLVNLAYLDLSDNQLSWLSTEMFQGLLNIDFMFLNNNTLKYVDMDIFKDTVNITFIDLSENQLKTCPGTDNLTQISLINIRDNPLTAITHDTFTALPANSELAVSQHEICACYVPVGVYCNAADNRSPYLTCDRLLTDRILVVLMWLIGLNALGGNIFVLIWRQKHTKQYKVQDLLLSNLAMSDSLMGFYMIIVGCADIYYGEYFPMQSETWRSGITCKVAGALSIASTQLSVFFLTLISIDRLIGIKYPYSTNKLGKQSTIVTAVLIWVCSLALGIVPSILSGRNFKFYDNSHVCIGLPLALTKTYLYAKSTTIIRPENTNLMYPKDTFTTDFTGLVNGLYYSTSLFLGLNCVCYLIILCCYIEIVRMVLKSAKESGRTPDMDEQIRLTRKVTAIVATDFMCISPIIVLGILVQTRIIELPPSVYAWSVTFVLPINSAINPYLYTIAEIISTSRKKKADDNIKQHDDGSTEMETVSSRKDCTTNVP